MRSKNTDRYDYSQKVKRTYCCRRRSGSLLLVECVDDGVKGFVKQTGSFFARRYKSGDQPLADGVGKRNSYPVNFSFPNETVYFGILVRRPATLT